LERKAWHIEPNFTASLPLQECLHETLTFVLYVAANDISSCLLKEQEAGAIYFSIG
jgi:hypothetical protein